MIVGVLQARLIDQYFQIFFFGKKNTSSYLYEFGFRHI